MVARSALLFTLLSISVLAADNPFLGTWKLNVEKSKFKPGSGPKDEVVKTSAEGASIRRITTGTNADGSPVMEGGPEGILFPWDGKEHLVTTPPAPPVTVSVTPLNSHTVHVIVKQGNATENVHSVASKDGKTITETSHGVDQKGHKTTWLRVWDKE